MTNSLDVFDTALFRKVYLPADIFKLIEQKVGNDFYNKRIEAEKKAREINIFYNIYDIYKFLPDFDVDMEIDTELKNCKANEKILELYKQDPTNYVFISDMYLPSKVIKKMLEHVGYKTPNVFVSCELKAYKGDGSLFRKVQNALGVTIKKHYGDNYIGDIEGAKKGGIPEVEFNPALHKIEKPIPDVRDVRLKKYLAEVLCEGYSAEDKIALLIAPVVLGFTKWVLRKRKKGQKIFFLSRDMYIPYIIAREYLKAEDVYYLHASRKSLGSVCLQTDNEKFLRKMRLVYTEEEMAQKRKEGTTEVCKYLNKYNIKNGDIVADLGYGGTIQAAIELALGIKMTGLYMQLFPEIQFDINATQYLQRRVINTCMIIEMAVGSSEDCVDGYKNEEVQYKPENKERKKLAERLNKVTLEKVKEIIDWNLSIFDIEQILIHFQFYSDSDILEVLNRKIYSNKNIGDSIINFDKEEIKKGRLFELYKNSYSHRLFKKLLEEDIELKHLSSLL